MWIKNESGEQSASLTLATIAFFAVTLAYVLAIIESIGPVAIRPFDAAAAMAFLIPCLSLYFGRRLTKHLGAARLQRESPSAAHQKSTD